MPDIIGVPLVIGILIVFIRSFRWRPEPKQVYDPEKEAGKALLKLLKIINK